MKKMLLTAMLCSFGMHTVLSAQEVQDVATSSKKSHFYIGLGAAFTDYKINDKIADSGLTKIYSNSPEISVGYNITNDTFLFDVELNGDYMGYSTTDDIKETMTATGTKLRFHYVPYKTESTLFSAGIDLSYLYTIVNIYSQNRTLDLNNINPDTQTGVISIYNNMLFAGPSISFGAFQQSGWPLRLTAGYEWGFTNGKWTSEFVNVNNTVKESGQGRFYTKLILYF